MNSGLAAQLPQWIAAALNTCAVPLRRRQVGGEDGWCSHRWMLAEERPSEGETCVECRWCGHSLWIPNRLLEGGHKGFPHWSEMQSVSSPNITGT